MKLKRLCLVFALCSLSACSAPPAEPVPAAESEAEVHWSYSGETGPEHWGELDPEFLVCSQGVRQSPINLESTAEQGEPDPVLNLTASRPHLLNNGHTVEVSLADPQHLQLASQEYTLGQFHFHSPSEHTLQGEEFPLEMHFVFRAGDQLAVLGVMVREGAHNDALDPFWSDLPRNEGEQGNLGVLLDPAPLFPVDRTQYRYPGSLTTPPCSEGVQWIVFREPIEMSPEQMQAMTQILGKNNRPRQGLGGRSVNLDPTDG